MLRWARFFVHDALLAGALRDFPRTVDTPIDIETTVGCALQGLQREQTLQALNKPAPT